MRKAFTLVETLIVIAVFGTGILAVLYGISQTLGNQDKAKTQITASFLAREGIELMYHLRDSNYRKSLPRNCVFQNWNEANNGIDKDVNPFCPEYLRSGMVLTLAMDPENYVQIATGSLSASFEENFKQFQLFYATWGVPPFQYVQHLSTSEENTDQALRYARYLLITPVYENGQALPEEHMLKIESHVLIQKGALTGEKVMESFIWNYEL